MKNRLLFLFLFAFSNAQNQNESDILWRPLLDIPNATFESAFLPPYINFQTDVLSSPFISSTCKRDLETALAALDKRQNWAVALFNAWAKFPPSGSVAGTLTDFGDYDQCLSIPEYGPITSQYCLLDLALPLPAMPETHNYFHKTPGLLPEETQSESPIHQLLLNGSFYRHLENHSSVFYYAALQLGICLPEGCSEKEIAVITEKNIQKLGLGVRSLHCEVRPTSSSFELTSVQLFAIGFLLLVICLNVAAAVRDRLPHKKAHLGSVLLWFSPERNVRKLIFSKSSNDDLSCLHGLRFFSICWVVVGHTLEWNNMNIFRDTFFVRDRLALLLFQPIFKAPFAVETFFYLSGLLTSYMTLKFTAGKYARFSYASFIFLRYLRLTPQLAIFLLLTTLLPPLFDGPIWYSYMGKISENCALTWYNSLLYLNNFIDFEHFCAIHTWFLANDMQLHMMALPAVVLLLRNRRHGLLYTKAFITLAVILCSIKTYVEQFPPDTVITAKTDFRDTDGNLSRHLNFYFKPYIHIIPFFVGFIFGDYMINHKIGYTNQILSEAKRYSLWFLVVFLYIFEIYNTVPYLTGRPYDPLWSAFVFPLTRFTWALMLSLIIWLCSTGNSGFIGRILSWSGFRPFARITYSVYLTHAWILWVALGTRRDLIDISGPSIVLLVSGVLLAVYIIGFAFAVFFEAPLFHLLAYFKEMVEKRMEAEKVQQTGREMRNWVKCETGAGEGKELENFDLLKTQSNV